MLSFTIKRKVHIQMRVVGKRQLSMCFIHSSLQVSYGTTSGASCLDGLLSTNPQTNHNRCRTDGS